MDVVHGYTQALWSDTSTGQLRIPDLMVKDYPILIELRDVR